METQFPYQQKLGENLQYICQRYFNGSKSYMEKLTGIGRDSLRRLINGEIDAPSITDLLQIYAAIKREPINDPNFSFSDLILFHDWAASELTSYSRPQFDSPDDSSPSLHQRAELMIDSLTDKLSVIRDFDKMELFQLENALAHQDFDTDIIYRTFSDLDYPFYDCEECKRDHSACYADSLDDKDAPDATIGCFRRWCQALSINEKPAPTGIEPTSQE